MNKPENPRIQESKTNRHPALKATAMLLIPFLIVALVSCDTGQGDSNTPRQPYAGVPEGKPPNLGAPVPNPKEVLQTKSAGQMPDFLSQLDGAARTKAQTLYKGAVDDYDVFQHVPCYCGCAAYESPHKNLAECFIKEKKANGEVVFTDHGLTCDICQQGAQMTMDGVAKGTPPKDIRANVYNKLKYTGIWTDTPPAP
jgi:Protein of unknown function with PCYCGC motif